MFDAAGTFASDALILKCVPPRSKQAFLVRPRLAFERLRQADVQVIEVCAPHGFGKTHQFSQWHREALLAGWSPMWLSIDEKDEPARLIRGLTESALRSGGGMLVSQTFADWVGTRSDITHALTAWLGEIAQTRADTLLVLDDVEKAPTASRELLHYLVENAPANLRIGIGCRPTASPPFATLLKGVAPMRLSGADLRLREDETIKMVRQILGNQQSAETAIMIHGLTDGWPLGVRLAVSLQLRDVSSEDFRLALSADLGQYFIDNVLGRLAPELRELLVDAAHLDPLHADLCAAVSGSTSAGRVLSRLAIDTPLLAGSGTEGWYRLHPAAQTALIGIHDSQLPEERRKEIARVASAWYADRRLLQEAASQARLANDDAAALKFAAASLRAMTTQGRNAEILAWGERLSPAELPQHPEFWAPTAWSLVMSNRIAEAHRFVALIRGWPAARDEDLFEAELVEVAGAAYSDDLAVLEAFARRWPRPPSWIDAPETMLHAVSHAHCALLNGQTDLARKSLADLPRDRGGLSPVPIGFSDALLGLTYLWEGKPQLAADSLRQSLAMAERRMDRRNRVVCTLAALLAQACLQIGDVEEAQRRLALRLPVIEKEAIPDGAIAAFLCLGEIAGEQGRQDQASVQFASLAAEGAARGSPRMQAAASFALTRFHSGRGRPHLATEEAKRARSIVAGLDVDASPAIRNWCELHACLAEATAAVNSAKAGAQLEAVTAAASEALRLATRLNRGADVARALFLRAQCVRPEDPRRADTDRDEAVSLCRASAHWRLLAEFDEADPGRPLSTTALPVSAPVQSAAPADDPRSILTPREQDVLTRLTQRMSNKEIAQSIGLGEETVKWHLKNLFQKLGAHDRVSAVSRARLLGFI